MTQQLAEIRESIEEFLLLVAQFRHMTGAPLANLEPAGNANLVRLAGLTDAELAAELDGIDQVRALAGLDQVNASQRDLNERIRRHLADRQ